ncbi:TetR/AcrR family transcriptional regulator [Rhodococcus sp. NPDC057529]|uniref:TetR/AcrR family transcriptional regulator n=1 Tax=Rhodococcus sp. NPDC057529 TaxID=3346158 RepID=UPI00366AA2A7
MAKQMVSDSPRRRRRPTKQGVVLSEQAIIETALRLLRHHGSAGLSARRLGAALGADPSTLYRYFRGIDDLTLAIADELIGRSFHGWEPTGDWWRDLYALGIRSHAAYLDHPQAAVLSASRVSGRASEQAAVDTILGILREAGFPDGAAVRLYRAFVDQMLAFAALDGAELALPDDVRESDRELWRSSYTQLPAETHPNIAATAGLLVGLADRSAYPDALELFLDGARTLLQRLDAARPPAGA